LQRILIIGGSDAGISAALRAKDVDPQVEVTVVVAETSIRTSASADSLFTLVVRSRTGTRWPTGPRQISKMYLLDFGLFHG